MKTSLFFRLLSGRLLTRSGDQAWDFAVPIVLLKILPNHLRIAALYYLLIRLAGVVLLPRVASVIDARDRMWAIRFGLGLQLLGVGFGTVALYFVWDWGFINPTFSDMNFLVLFALLVTTGVIGSLGANLMDIAIANDLAPSVFEGDELTRFNGRFRQVDLFTEVASPVLAGLLLALPDSSIPLLGFFLIALWNIISFFPEYAILRSVFLERSDLIRKPIPVSESAKETFLAKFVNGWRDFFREPIAPVMIAYALLWLSVLSPHGVLLTGFLKDGWNLPEWMIGLFRGSGAVFGLLATMIFPIVVRKLSLARASFWFLAFQSIMVLLACAAFQQGSSAGQVWFLILILFSRIGLYGFSLGEMQIRQEGIAVPVRGRVNGFASALTGLATLGLFGAGAILPETGDFRYLIYLSTFCIVLGFGVYAFGFKLGKGK